MQFMTNELENKNLTYFLLLLVLLAGAYDGCFPFYMHKDLFTQFCERIPVSFTFGG